MLCGFVTGCCEYGNELSVGIKRKCFEHFSNFRIFKKYEDDF